MAPTGKHAATVLEAQLSLTQLAATLQSPWPAALAAALSIASSTLAFASSPDRTLPPSGGIPGVLPSGRGLRGWMAFLFAFSLLMAGPQAGRVRA